MANKQIGSLDGLGFVNKQRTGNNVSAGGSLVADVRSYATVTDLRNALQTFNATYYTSALLDRLTTNDMVYAVRVQIDGGTSSAGVI